jgi:hypothetical protein
MERMTLLRPNSSKCEASGNPEAADRKRTLYSDWKGFQRLVQNSFKAHSDKRQLKSAIEP